MDALVLSTLLIQSIGIVVTVVSLALTSCLPTRQRSRNWISADASVAARPAAPVAAETHLADAELPQAA